MIGRVMVFLFLLFALQPPVFAHGGVVEEDDICVIKVNYLRAHFKVYRPAALEPDIYSVVYTFAEEGDFIGIVSATNTENGEVYAAVFPFEVGFTGWGYWPLLIGILVLSQVQYLAMSGRLKRWFAKATPVVLVLGALLLPVSQPAHAGEFIVTYTTPDGPPEINRMHSWILYIESDSGEPIEGADIEVDGGMPAHDHGLPTQPRVTADLGDGYYRLDGVRFHMSGYWEMFVTIRSDESEDTVVIPLTL